MGSSQPRAPHPPGAGAPLSGGRTYPGARGGTSARRGRAGAGVLYFSNNFFFQCLEGDQEQVEALYNKIATDPRHTRVQTLSLKRIDERLFSDWSMKYVALDHQVNRILRLHGKKSFNPYEFSETMIDRMLGLFVDAEDQSGQPQPDHKHSGPARPGLLSRLFGRKSAA